MQEYACELNYRFQSRNPSLVCNVTYSVLACKKKNVMLGSIEGACSINHRGDLMEKTGTLRYTLRLHRVEKIVIELKKSNEKEYSMTSNVLTSSHRICCRK